MAKLVTNVDRDINSVIEFVHNGILAANISASYEDGNDYSIDDIHCALRVYERFSYIGGNRVSLSILFVGNSENTQITAITSGGSQAVLFKINTWGEEAFLDKLRGIINCI